MTVKRSTMNTNAWRDAGVPQPRSMSMDLTEACNLNCTYCFTHSAHRRRVMSWDMAKRIVDWWLPQTKGVGEFVEITAWGGEPLLEWEMWKGIIAYSNGLARKHDIRQLRFGGTTNGILYTPDKVEWCAKHESLFMVSLDGIEPAHDMFRKMPGGKGSWKIVDKNVREAIKIVPNTKVRLSVHPDTLHWFFDSIKYFTEDLGATDIAFSPVYEADWDNEETLELLREQFRLTADYALQRMRDGKDIRLKHLNDAARSLEKLDLPPEAACGAGRQYMGWSVDGYGYPCHRFNKHGLSTEERAALPYILARPKGNSFEWCNVEYRKGFFDYMTKRAEKCGSCILHDHNMCNGNCPAVNFDLTGDIGRMPDKVCKFNTIQFEEGVRYGEIAAKEGLCVTAGWNEGKMNRPKSRSCTCYNMCYSEGTSTEIIHMDKKNSGVMCLCNMQQYQGDSFGPNRSLKEHFKVHGELRNKIPLLKQVLESKDFSEDEKKFLEQYLSLLNKALR